MFRFAFCLPLIGCLCLYGQPDRLRRLLKQHLGRKAVTSLEYGIIAALIAIMILSSVRNVGTQLSTTFNRVVIAL